MLGEDVDLCTKRLIFDTPRESRCGYVTAHCADKDQFFNYFDWYFCAFDQDAILIALACVSLLFLQIRMLEYTSDGFISQAISKISGYLKLTEAMAGATLLAFNNGATDVITALVAGASDSGDDDLAVGALFGASTFAVCIILGVVIYTTPEKTLYDLKRGNLVRDITTYLIAILTFIIIGLNHTSYWLIGSILVSIYLIYVTLVWLEERKKDSSIDQQNQLRQTMRKIYAAHG